MISEKTVSYIVMISRALYLYLVRGEIKRLTKQLETRPPSTGKRDMPKSVKLRLIQAKENRGHRQRKLLIPPPGSAPTSLVRFRGLKGKVIIANK